MKESTFTTSLKKLFIKNNPGSFWYKIPDSMGADGQKRPFDIFAVSPVDGVIFIEAKIHNSLSPFSFSKIEHHQIDALRRTSALGVKSFIVLGVRAITKEADRIFLGKDITTISANIWIPVDLIPGKHTAINVKSLKVRDLIKNIKLRGNRINEILMSAKRFEAYTK
jgi:hypothetical protein